MWKAKKAIQFLLVCMAVNAFPSHAQWWNSNQNDHQNPRYWKKSGNNKQVVVPMHAVSEQGIGTEVGTVTITESDYGVVFTPNLKELSPGVHGFHVHQNPSCDSQEKDGKMTAAQAAGGHYDPQMTNMHDFSWGNGHLGDLPPLYVEADGTSVQPVLAPRLKFYDIFNHALMIHAGGDNHSDHPAALGGGGSRISCGVITRDLITNSN